MPKISDPGRFAPAAASALATAGLLLLTGSRLLLLTRLSESGRPAWPVLLPAFFALFLALAALPRLALARGEVRLTLLAAPLAALALFVRAAVLEGLTYDYSTFLSRWAAFFRETGFAGLGQPVGDYNVPYLYFMALIAKIPANDLYLIKLLSIVFDVLLAWAGMLVCARLQERGFGAPADRRARAAWVRPLAVYAALLLLPTAVFNGALWAQCDSMYAALLLFSLYFALGGRNGAALVLAALAFSLKLQSVFLLPLFGALWLAGRVRFRTLLLFPLTYLATCVPALLAGRPLREILGIYLSQTGTYSGYLSLNAPSLPIFANGAGAALIPALSRAAVAAAFLFVLGLLAFLFVRRARMGAGAVFLAACALAVGVPLLLPHMHERYFFLADALLVILAVLRTDRLAAAAAMQAASLSGYHAYLTLRYARFPSLQLAALLLLGVLAVLLYDLVRETAAPAAPGRAGTSESGEFSIDKPALRGYND